MKGFFVVVFCIFFTEVVLATPEIITYHYDSSGKLTDIVGDEDFTIYKHDPAGNQVSNNHWLKRTFITDSVDLVALEIADANYMEILSIKSSGVTNLEEIGSIESLENLYLQDAALSLTEIEALVPNLTNISYLNIRNADFASADEVDFLNGMDNLLYVSLGGSSFYVNNCFDFLGRSVNFNDSDGDGADDCAEYLEETNLWNASSHPAYSRYFEGTDRVAVDFYGDLSSEVSDWEVKEGIHPIWSDFDGDDDLDIAIYVHGADEYIEELSCWYDCGDGYGGDWNGKLMFYRYDAVTKTFSRTSTSLSINNHDRPLGDINEAYSIDYNNDGYKDLLLVTTVINLYAGDSTMNFTRVTDTVGLNGITEYNVEILDANMDGYLDLFFGQDQLMVFNPLSGLYEDKALDISGNNWGSIIAAIDVDSDGMIDLISKSTDPNFPIIVHHNTHSPTQAISFTDVQLPAANFSGLMNTLNWEEHVEVTDYDGDGDNDLAIYETRIIDIGNGDEDYDGVDIRIIRNNTTSGLIDFSEALVLEHEGGNVDVSRGGTALDYNNDGLMDFMKVESGSGGARLFEQDVTGNFNLLLDNRTYSFIGDNFNALKNDIDGDGKLDLIIPKERMQKVEILKNLTPNNNGFTVKLVGDPSLTGNGTKTSKDALGAIVTIENGINTLTQQVHIMFGRDPILHFGVGAETTVDITVDWPSGNTVTLVNQDITTTKAFKIIETASANP